jgi:hypothetical protein
VSALNEMLSRRRDRAIAIILGVKERDCDRHLPPGAQAALRKVVLDQLNEFYEVSVDIIRSLDTGEVVLNEMWLQKLDEIHTAVVGNGNGNGGGH